METPPDLQICTVYKNRSEIIIDGLGQMAGLCHIPSIHEPWTNTIISRHAGDTTRLKEEWINGRLLIVSDGSAKDDKATGAWIITSETLYREGIFLEGSALSSGPTHIQDSH